MKRIFTTLAVLDGAGLAATLFFGVWYKLGGAATFADVFLVHFYLGLFTAIATLLVHCLIFTYFLGTGRWVKEVGLAYALPDEHLPRRTRALKRATFPPALAAMLVTIATAAAGAGAQLQDWPWQVHAALAAVTLLVNLAAFVIEYRNVSENGAIIDAVVREVDRIRAEHGLPTNEEALQQEEV